MNVGYVENQTLSEVNGCKLIAEVNANHYFHWDSYRGEQFNEIDRYDLVRYTMIGPTGKHTIENIYLDSETDVTPKQKNELRKRMKAHWAGFCGESETKIKSLNMRSKKWFEK